MAEMLKWILLFTLAFPAAAKTVNCRDIGAKMREKLTVPYKDFADENLKSCVEVREVNSRNLPLFIAAMFYYESLDIRKMALTKLEKYECEDKMACGELYMMLDGQIKAATMNQPKGWADFRTRSESLRTRAMASFDKMKNSRILTDSWSTRHDNVIVELNHAFDKFKLAAEKEKFAKNQKAWSEFAEKNCLDLYSASKEGTGYPEMMRVCRERSTKARVEDLRDVYFQTFSKEMIDKMDEWLKFTPPPKPAAN